MPSTRPTVDPVLDILEEMGYDFDELDGDGYKRSLKEAIIKLTIKDPKDPRIGILTLEFQKVKGSRKVEPKEKKTTIKASKFLPGRGKFSVDDIKPDGEDKKSDVIAFLNGEVTEKLDIINADVVAIKDSLVEANDLAEEKDEEIRQAILADKKKKREKDLEDKKGGLKDKMLESVTKPVGNFLNKLIKFVMMTFVGSVINRVLTLLKDPAQLLDPIKRFFNLLIGMVNAVMKGLWQITGAPLNFIIGGINNGVKFLIDSLNKATGLLKIPPIDAPEIPLVPGPPEFQFIPLSETAQAKNEAVGMAGGGMVPGVDGMDGLDGEVGIAGAPGVDGLDGMASIGMDGVDGMGVAGKDGSDGISPVVKPKKFSGGGVVPYNNPFVLGTGHNVIDTAPGNIMGYNKGGKVPGSGTGDTVPAMLTPGEFVMSKGAVDKIGTDNLMAMNKAGGGTNVPKMMKFAGGGVVPEIGTPPKKGGKVVVIGGGGGSRAPRGVASSGSSGESRRFSSTDPNNMTIPVVKSLYNIMS